MLLQSPSRTIPVGLLDFQGQFSNNMGAIFAGRTLATVPLASERSFRRRSLAVPGAYLWPGFG